MNLKITNAIQDSWLSLDSKWDMPEKSIFYSQYVLPLLHSAEDAEHRAQELERLCQELSAKLCRLESEFGNE